jgi:hypothetical protein
MVGVIDFIRNLWGGPKEPKGRSFSFDRPLVLLQSDDWGRVGVRDKQGYELLRTDGVRLGENPYDFYTLETAEDVMALADVLRRHRDYTGRSACVAMNFVMSNLNFPKMAAGDFRQIELLPLSDGLPGSWQRPGLLEAYRQGIADGVFYPGLHGLTHFCSAAVESAIAKGGERAAQLRTLWKAETPYIYWRMPWIGYEYSNPEKPHAGFLSAEKQASVIGQAAKIFEALFSKKPLSACAPGYRADQGTHRAWSQCGVRVVQNGSGSPLPPHMDECEMLNLHRTIDIEPTQRDLPTEKYVQLAESCFARGVPAIVSVHAINFHSSLKDFRTPTLQTLHQFLSALEAKHPNLLYVHDADLYDIVTKGKLRTGYSQIPVAVKARES